MPSNIKATISILTYNGDTYLQEILDAVIRQRVDFAYEVLIIDSGSTDRTLAIIKEAQKKHESIRLHSIDSRDFGHGKTRNLVAQMAKGDIVVYLTHDATPAHDTWLYEITQPFEITEKVVGVMGKQLPRAHCIPMLKYEINAVFSNFGPDFGTHLFFKDSFIQDQATYDAVRFYSDVNSAARKEFLLKNTPYRDVAYAEDQLFGQDVIDTGYIKVYAPRGAVIHSNDLTLQEYRKRLFDETLGLRNIGIAMSVPGKKVILKMILKGILKDAVRIVKDRDYSVKRKIYWLVVNPFFHIEKWRGIREALLVDLSDKKKIARLSLEKSKK